MTKGRPEHVTLDRLAVGARLVIRSRTDWRPAAISRMSEERIVLTVCSPTGRTYRLSREPGCPVRLEGTVPVLLHDQGDDWRENFSPYDARW